MRGTLCVVWGAAVAMGHLRAYGQYKPSLAASRAISCDVPDAHAHTSWASGNVFVWPASLRTVIMNVRLLLVCMAYTIAMYSAAAIIAPITRLVRPAIRLLPIAPGTRS